MAENSLYPAYLVIDYSSSYAPHKMTLPIHSWENTGLDSHALGGSTDWDDIALDVEDVMDDFIPLLAACFQDSVNFNAVSVFTLETKDSPPLFRASKPYSAVGTNASTAANKAYQTSYNFLDTEGAKFRLTFLDAPIVGYDRTVGLTALTAAEQAVLAAIANTGYMFASRNGQRINTFRSRTTTLNEKLRRAYRMA